MIEDYLLLGIDISNLRNSHYPYNLLKYALDRELYIEDIPSSPIDFATRIINKQFNKNFTNESYTVINACLLICDNIDPAPLFQFELDKDKQKELMAYLRSGLDFTYFKEDGFSSDQLRKIRQGLEHSLDVSIYAKTCFSYEQMHVLYKALLQGMDPSLFADPKYSREQMEELRFGLSLNIDIKLYANHKLSTEKMRFIRECIYHSSYTNCLSNPRIPLPILKVIANHLYRKKLKVRTLPEKEIEPLK